MALLPLGLLAKHWLALGRFPFACLPGVMEGPQGPEGCPAPSAPGPDLQASAPRLPPWPGLSLVFHTEWQLPSGRPGPRHSHSLACNPFKQPPGRFPRAACLMDSAACSSASSFSGAAAAPLWLGAGGAEGRRVIDPGALAARRVAERSQGRRPKGMNDGRVQYAGVSE